jgi:hypothetical protein
MKNFITSIKRIYSIKTPKGVKLDIESERPLKNSIVEKLLEEDSEIELFFENFDIVGIQKIENKSKKIRLRRIRHKRSNNVSEKESIEMMPSRPYERINLMLSMEGDFTRKDYQTFIEDKNNKISDFQGHTDIRDAIILGKIEETGERIGKKLRRYRIIDTRPVDLFIYKKIIGGYKRTKIEL